MSSLRTVSTVTDVWELVPTRDDVLKGAAYAAVSLPWTFNRMNYSSTNSVGQQMRALNIAKGIVGQEVLRRKLLELGIEVELQEKSHRDEDLFDLRVRIGNDWKRLDFKTFNYYTDYNPLGREPLTSKLIIDNRDYSGPEWRRFFPMLIPHNQIGQDKEIYCFAISSSVDLRRNNNAQRVADRLVAFPYGPAAEFLTHRRLCEAREQDHKGFRVSCTWEGQIGIFAGAVSLVLTGEWDGQIRFERITLKPGMSVKDVGPFSCLSSIEIDRESLQRLDGRIVVSVSSNDCTRVVRNSSQRNINQVPREPLVITQSDFCNLVLPNDYRLFVVGWISKDEFLTACRKYLGWIWPNDKVDPNANQQWIRVTEKDKGMLRKTGFDDCIIPGKQLRAGWLKGHGQGGACCYYYPNIGRNGGVRETNLYVVPSDLRTMRTLGSPGIPIP